MWPPSWLNRKRTRISIPVVGALMLGGAGCLLGPFWAVGGAVVGAVAASSIAGVVVMSSKPDPVRLLRDGRPEEAYRILSYDLATARKLAKRPAFRDLLANRLEWVAKALQALGNEPRALEVVTEATAIYTELIAARPDRYSGALARTQLRQADLLAHMGRHGEALAAVETAIQVYRRLVLKDRSVYLPRLAEALARQSDELGYLDRITEARTAAAEVELIHSDMLPSAQS